GPPAPADHGDGDRARRTHGRDPRPREAPGRRAPALHRRLPRRPPLGRGQHGEALRHPLRARAAAEELKPGHGAGYHGRPGERAMFSAKRLALSAAVLVALGGAGRADDDEPKAAPEYDWGVAYYMSYDNNLEQ